MNYHKYYLIDTNILLEDATNIFKLSDSKKNLILLSETVLDEIDAKKSGFEEINFQAREFARVLESSKILATQTYDEHKIVTLEINGIDSAIIDIISKNEYITNSKNISLNIYNDRKILEIAQFARDYYSKDLIFLSLDIMARIRAISLDIKTEVLKGASKDEFDFDFNKTISIPFEKIEFLENSEISSLDNEYNEHNFTYNFKVKNSDQIILATIKQNRVYILNEEKIRDQAITPLNKEQLLFSNAILDPFYNILVIDAIAGSGKTLLALSGALKLVKKKEFQRIIYIRNSIESLDKGEDVGYLPGLEEKFKIYNHPLMDSLDYIIRAEHKRKKAHKKTPYEALEDFEVTNKIEDYIKNYNIETMWIGEMRGRTLSNAFIIVDEAQNMSNKTMQMVLSRVDSSCKVVILGSNKQIDNFYVNKHTNALTTLLRSTEEKQELINIFAIKLQKVLRGPITQWAENIFSKKK